MRLTVAKNCRGLQTVEIGPIRKAGRAGTVASET